MHSFSRSFKVICPPFPTDTQCGGRHNSLFHFPEVRCRSLHTAADPLWWSWFLRPDHWVVSEPWRSLGHISAVWRTADLQTSCSQTASRPRLVSRTPGTYWTRRHTKIIHSNTEVSTKRWYIRYMQQGSNSRVFKHAVLFAMFVYLENSRKNSNI